MKHLNLFENFYPKNLDYLLSKLDTYNLNKEDFAIFGSAPLVVKGELDDANDLDVIVKPSAWNFPTPHEWRTKDIEFFDNWPGFDVDDLIMNHCFVYRGYNFVNTEFVYKYKKEMKRDKDKSIWNK